MRGKLAAKDISPRQQFELIVKGIGQELLEAARALGFDTKSKPKLLTAIERELALWYREARQDPGNSWFHDIYTTAPHKWDRPVCLEILRFNHNIYEDLDTSGDVFEVLDGLDEELKALRARLAGAQRQKPPSNGD